MKEGGITFGEHLFGTFAVSISSCDGRSAEVSDFFEVLVHERRDMGIEPPPPYVSIYVDIVSDPRFQWWSHLGKFERHLTADDVVEYNRRCADVFHKIEMPTFKLARHSIPRLERLCLDITKAARKTPKGDR
jgi:hypothetical protein